MACRAVWKVSSDDVELARLQIASKRLRLHEVLSCTQGVQFYFSCVTCVMSNAKSAQTSDEESAEAQSYPGIAFFIVYKECETCSEEILFSALHKEDMEPEITPIRVRSNEMEKAAKQLFNVVKDHNNPTIQDMLDISNVYCYRNARDWSSDSDEDDTEVEELLQFGCVRFPVFPCCLVVDNVNDFRDQLNTSVARLQSDGLVVDLAETRVVDPTTSCLSSNNDVTKTIFKIQKVMQICNHGLYKSQIYVKPDKATITFIHMMDVTSYLHRLMANEQLRDKLVQHFLIIQKFLSHPACEIIPQLEFDLDLIEVLNGYCFSIKSRCFIPCPIPTSMLGKVSPRSFVPYDHSTPPQPRYFKEGILNSFSDEGVRANFLNKFYQCLLAFNMPHKVKKLVVAGPKDSGKTSWSNIFHRLIPANFISSLTNERQFSAAMITNETQLVIVDEWSATRMESDLAKCILQGGWMVTAVKHGLPRTILNNSPYYITTNEVPDFGKDDENVRRRIAIFTTTSLPRTRTGIDRWLYDHAMDCVAWIANEINNNRHLLPQDELWYEQTQTPTFTISAKEGESLFDHSQLKQISHADLRRDDNGDDHETGPAIHESFAAEARARRLRRKRRAARTSPCDEESTESEMDIGRTLDIERETSQSISGELQQHPPTVPETQEPDTFQPPSNISPSSSDQLPEVDTHQSEASENPPATDIERDEAETVQPPSNSCDTVQVPENEDEMPSSGEGLSSLQMARSSPTTVWTLNSKRYMGKVAGIIKYGHNSVTKAHVHSFLERLRKAELKRTKEEHEFWTKADPEIDAWMIMTGRQREVFDVSIFAKQNPEILPHLKSIRDEANVLVLRSRCPIAREMEKQRRERDGETSEEKEEVPSQSYWTVVKKWMPW